jgi:hypothetical protein
VPDTCRLTELETVGNDSCSIPEEEEEEEILVIIDQNHIFSKNYCTNKNHSYKYNEQINNQNIDNSKCFGVKFVKIYPEMTSQ